MGKASASKRRPKRERRTDRFVARPFEGLAGETDWVAMREVVPAATATIRLTEAAGAEHVDTEVTVATVLPLTWPGLVTPDGRRVLAAQAPARSGDLSRDLAQALELALTAPPNHRVVLSGLPGEGPRLQDLIAAGDFEIRLHPNFGFWENTVEPETEEITAGRKRADEVMEPTAKLDGTPSAFWCRTEGKAQVRWVLPYGEDLALQALSRVYAEDKLSLGDDTKYVGTFRAHGLLAPVWELPSDAAVDDWSAPVAKLAARLADATTLDTSLTADERRARDTLRQGQVTIR